MALGSFQLLLHIVGQWPAVLVADAGLVGYLFYLFFFFYLLLFFLIIYLYLIYLPFLMSCLFWDTAEHDIYIVVSAVKPQQ